MRGLYEETHSSTQSFRLYSSNANRGSSDDYGTTIQINLDNYAFVGNKKIVDIYTLQNDDNKKLTNKFMIIHIYLANLREKWYTCGIENLTETEKALLVFIEPSIADSYEFGKGIDIMEEFIKDAIKASKNEILLEAYDKEWALKDEGKREGYDSGYDSGFDDGIEQTKIEIVRNMLKENSGIDFISKVSGLSIEKIEEIKNNI